MRDWRLILGDGAGDGDAVEPGAAGGARNMAVDHALFESVQAGGRPVLRLYRWQPACLSFGRHQHARGIYDVGRLAAAGIDAVRRPTGGLAVLHHLELTYCVLVPEAALGGPRETYRRINAALVEAMRGLGVAAVLAAGGGASDPRAHSAQPCFRAPADGEVVAAGRKLIGSAQRRERHTLLQHGSILLDGSQEDVLRLLADTAAPHDSLRPRASAAAEERYAAALAGTGATGGGAGPMQARTSAPPAPRVVRSAVPEVLGGGGSTTLRELLGAVPAALDVAHAVAHGMAGVCGIRLAPASLTCDESDRAGALEAMYGDAGWTWRR